jgi:hypothetical protein
VLKTLMLHEALVIPFPLDHHNCTEPVAREGAVGPIRRSGLSTATGVRHSGRIEREDGWCGDMRWNRECGTRVIGGEFEAYRLQSAGLPWVKSCEGRRSGLGSRSERSLSGVAPQQAQSLGLTSPPVRALEIRSICNDSVSPYFAPGDGKRHLLHRLRISNGVTPWPRWKYKIAALATHWKRFLKSITQHTRLPRTSRRSEKREKNIEFDDSSSSRFASGMSYKAREIFRRLVRERSGKTSQKMQSSQGGIQHQY